MWVRSDSDAKKAFKSAIQKWLENCIINKKWLKHTYKHDENGSAQSELILHGKVHEIILAMAEINYRKIVIPKVNVQWIDMLSAPGKPSRITDK